MTDKLYRIKPLEWRECVSHIYKKCYSAGTGRPVSDWYNIYVRDDGQWCYTCGQFPTGYEAGGYATVEECKQLAEQHYYARLAAALEEVQPYPTLSAQAAEIARLKKDVKAQGGALDEVAIVFCKLFPDVSYGGVYRAMSYIAGDIERLRKVEADAIAMRDAEYVSLADEREAKRKLLATLAGGEVKS